MPPAADYAAVQAAVSTQVAAQSASAFAALVRLGQVEASVPDLAAAIAALVHKFGSVTALAAGRYYENVRLEAGVSGTFTPPLADPAGLDQVTASVKWATRNLYRPDQDVPAVRASVQAVAEKMTLDAGRDTVTGAVQADRQALGYARVTEPGACSFCLLLATRGAVYKSEKSALTTVGRGRALKTRGSRDLGEPFHDHCRCHVEPVFTAYEPSAEIRHWQAVYAKAARAGSGKAVRDEFRRLVEAERAR